MRGALVLHLIGEAIAKWMLAGGAGYTTAAQWLLEWESQLSQTFASSSTADVVASRLIDLLQQAGEITVHETPNDY